MILLVLNFLGFIRFLTNIKVWNCFIFLFKLFSIRGKLMVSLKSFLGLFFWIKITEIVWIDIAPGVTDNVFLFNHFGFYFFFLRGYSFFWVGNYSKILDFFIFAKFSKGFFFLIQNFYVAHYFFPSAFVSFFLFVLFFLIQYINFARIKIFWCIIHLYNFRIRQLSLFSGRAL